MFLSSGSSLSFPDKWLDFLFSERVNFYFLQQLSEEDAFVVLLAVLKLERGLF